MVLSVLSCQLKSVVGSRYHGRRRQFETGTKIPKRSKSFENTERNSMYVCMYVCMYAVAAAAAAAVIVIVLLLGGFVAGYGGTGRLNGVFVCSYVSCVRVFGK